MKRAIIFANGRMDITPPLVADLHADDLIIAADGGTQHCKSLGITPNVIIGDLDSLGIDEIRGYREAGTEIIQYPTHKDETDLELALSFAVNHSVTHVAIVGALGNRWDMTFANILLALHVKFAQLSIRLLDGSDELVILRGEGQLDINERSGDTLSLIPVGGDAHGITTHGLVYPLADETLFFGSSRGVSNVIISDQARVFFKAGALLICISDRDSYSQRSYL